MATEVLFDFWDILVNNIFGSVAMAIMGIALVLWVILMLCKVSAIFQIHWMIFYFLVMGTGYIGALALVGGFIITLTYFVISFARFAFPSD